jgi:hypothetical protein
VGDARHRTATAVENPVTEQPLTQAGESGGAESLQPTARPPSRTPLYEASHAARYERQSLVKEIQKSTGCRLITYVAGNNAPIDRDDAISFADLLHNVSTDDNLDLMLHTPGGDIDSAEKLIYMVRKKVRNAQLRIIVPDFAKSAGTLMVLGADEVVMSDTSELGPIDPQVVRRDGNGNRLSHSVLNYLDAYKTHREALLERPSSLPDQIMLGKLDPETIKLFEAVRDRAKRFAEQLLQRGMFRNKPGNWSKLASDLIDIKRWPTHGQMISSEDAVTLELTVKYMDQKDAVWTQIWRLYCRQRLALAHDSKLFESDHVSLQMDKACG